MIISTTAILREHLSVNASIDIKRLAPSLKKAERNFLKPLVGVETMKLLESETLNKIIKEAQNLAQEAVANFAYYLYLPLNAVQISDNGIHVVDNENTRSASDKQFKELQRSFKTSGHEALDALLEILEASPDIFPDWFKSDSYKKHKDLLVNKTAIFNEHYYIFNSRQTFMALQPRLKVVEDQFIAPVIGEKLLLDLKNSQTNKNRKKVKTYLQKAIVSFTIMDVVYNGMFVLDAQGIHMKFDVLPYEKTVTNVNLKVNDFLTHTKKTKQNEGEEYLKIAIDLIKKNIEDFEEYTIKETPKHIKLADTNSIVGLV